MLHKLKHKNRHSMVIREICVAESILFASIPKSIATHKLCQMMENICLYRKAKARTKKYGRRWTGSDGTCSVQVLMVDIQCRPCCFSWTSFGDGPSVRGERDRSFVLLASAGEGTTAMEVGRSHRSRSGKLVYAPCVVSANDCSGGRVVGIVRAVHTPNDATQRHRLCAEGPANA